MKEAKFQLGSQVFTGLISGEDGPVVLGLHGFLDNAASLVPLQSFFEGFQFIALDMAGHGHSQHRADGAHYNQLDYVQDLHELITQQEWRDVILVGHSLGGIVASIYASVFPENVKALVSIDSCGPLTQPETATVEQIRSSILSRQGKYRSKFVMVDHDAAVTARCRVTDMRESDASAIINRSIGVNGAGESYWQSDSRLRTKSPLRLTELQAEAIVKNIQCPVLVIGADASFKQLDKVYEQRKAWFKNVQFVQFAGGHHIHMENTQNIGATIRRFVDQM
ncbi:alpha/beta hydrolase [Alteromonas sp. KUL49]|uniref:alpha/beta fold hydrolase n=1 Tax=Alteromonas sp. KUL49 TaxID=2480798 RepID=UPI00102ED75B|nr:alpha/beta hydrolase [Alteromonas sp. KUL49]TAP35494.1 alpha/beta hydrolase [Alteromonas sp. KUL49]GEA13372.1 alpha/beta hydrolase [Alteromonas sp. KUL49]